VLAPPEPLEEHAARPKPIRATALAAITVECLIYDLLP
jgi:hypothetical protein